MIEVFKNEESGHGDILSPEFVEWRYAMDMNEVDREIAKARPTGSPNHELCRT